MSESTTIEWTDATWNPITGCTKVSPGCQNCYAETFAERWRGVHGHPYEQGFDLRLWPNRLELPLAWKKPRMIFVNSMSDLFHEKVPLDFIQRVFRTMEKAHWHTFQILTKRSERLTELALDLTWPPNVWMGVSIETTKYLWRAEHLRKVPATVRFLSLEPLFGPLSDLDLSGMHWVIVGGESGPRARPMHIDWVRPILSACRASDIPFFWKQGGIWAPAERYMVSHFFHTDGRLVPYADGPLLCGSTNRKDNLVDLSDPGWIRIRRWRKRAAEQHWPEELKVRQWPKLQDRTGYENQHE
jgi:protein gp37